MTPCFRLTITTALSLLLHAAAAAAPPVASCAESVNHDVDVSDLLAVLSEWGECPASGFCQPDLDVSGVVDVLDLLDVLDHWGEPCVDAGTFPDLWINGANCQLEPALQVHRFNENMYIIRQSMCTDFEGPFMYLIFGEDKVFMQDTGAAPISIAPTVYQIIDDWLDERDRDSIELIVTHSHSHGDHVAGDSQFTGQPNTTVVGTSTNAVISFFGFINWPNDIVQFDLGGGRVLDIIAIPGHQSAHIAVYDRHTGILLTGDSLYPGRLYISAFSQYLASITRLTEYVVGRPVAMVLGTHIEMSNTPGDDYPIGSTHHPDEHELQLDVEHLFELREGLIDMAADPEIEVHDDFIIYPLF